MSHTKIKQCSLVAALAAVTLIGPTRVLAQATIDETPFAKGGSGIVLYVNQSAAASDTNTGQDPKKPLATIAHAVTLADTLTNTKPVKIKVGVGTYRESLLVEGGDSLLEIEGTVPGKVILSGSQAKGWELAQWTPVPGAPGLYKKAWPYHYGLVPPTGNDFVKHYDNMAIFRREAIYVNGTELKPVQLEDFSWDYHDGAPAYTYKGYHDPTKDPALIPPGSFGANTEKDDHPDAHTLFFRLPTGVDPKTATIEVPDDSLLTGPKNSKKTLLEIARSNIVLRNLTVTHVACLYNTAAAAININSYLYKPTRSNVVVDNCDFLWNNGAGLVYYGGSHGTILNSRFLHNGCVGFNPYFVDHLLIQDCNTSYNAWIAAISGDGFVPAGVKAQITDSTIVRLISNGNGSIGWWFDSGDPGNFNNTFSHCDFSNNSSHGVLFEIAQGPNTLTDCRMVGNGAAGLESSYAARQTTLDHCTLIDNGIDLKCEAQGGDSKIILDTVFATKLTHCTLVSTKGQTLVQFYNEKGYLTDPKALPNGGSRFQASGNTYWNSDEKKSFQAIWWDDHVGFADWQKKTGQDLDSKFDKPDIDKLMAWNPTAPSIVVSQSHTSHGRE